MSVMSKGFLVSLEGPEGAGKRVCLKLSFPVRKKNIEVLTREPGGVLDCARKDRAAIQILSQLQ